MVIPVCSQCRCSTSHLRQVRRNINPSQNWTWRPVVINSSLQFNQRSFKPPVPGLDTRQDLRITRLFPAVVPHPFHPPERTLYTSSCGSFPKQNKTATTLTRFFRNNWRWFKMQKMGWINRQFGFSVGLQPGVWRGVFKCLTTLFVPWKTSDKEQRK